MRLAGRRTIRITLSSGSRLEVRINDLLARRLLREEEFEWHTRTRMRELVREGMVVLDVGANFGYYAVQLAGWVGKSGRVIAFEPNPMMIEELQRNIHLNDLTNVVVRPFALSDTTGEVEFHCPPPGLEGHGTLRPNKTFSAITKIIVPTRRLDDVLSELGVGKVDFIKIDVEGAERNVLRGAMRLLSGEQQPTIIFECAETMCRAFGHSVLDLLIEVQSLGYQLEEIDHAMWCAIPVKRSRTNSGSDR